MLKISTLKISYLLFLICFVLVLGMKSKTQREDAIARAQIQATMLADAAKVVVKPINLEHLRCLANNIYHEASGEPFMGQVAVARVVMNRIKYGFAPNPCRVIYQSAVIANVENPQETKKVCQFSWVCEGKKAPDRNTASYQNAESIAIKVLSEDAWKDKIPTNVLFFHNSSVSPNWLYKRVMTIGNHTFYSKD